MAEIATVKVRFTDEHQAQIIELCEQYKAENAKLRELCKKMHEQIKYNCDVCDEYYCSSWDEDNECCIYDTYMREIKIEVGL